MQLMQECLLQLTYCSQYTYNTDFINLIVIIDTKRARGYLLMLRHRFCTPNVIVTLVVIFFDDVIDCIGNFKWMYFQKYWRYISQASFIQENMFCSTTLSNNLNVWFFLPIDIFFVPLVSYYFKTTCVRPYMYDLQTFFTMTKYNCH